MKMPWANHSGLSKWIVVCATVLMLSLGLCGVNFVAFLGLSSGKASQSWLGPMLAVTGYLELAAILLSFLGLVIGLVLKIGLSLFGSFDNDQGTQTLGLTSPHADNGQPAQEDTDTH